MFGGWLPAGILFVLAVVLGTSLAAMASLLGPRRPGAAKASAYECGMTPFGDAREPFPAKFYLVGVLFLLFDLETLLLIPWGIAAKGAGWEALGVGVLFLGILGVGLAYAWGAGVLDWTRDGEDD